MEASPTGMDGRFIRGGGPESGQPSRRDISYSSMTWATDVRATAIPIRSIAG